LKLVSQKISIQQRTQASITQSQQLSSFGSKHISTTLYINHLNFFGQPTHPVKMMSFFPRSFCTPVEQTSFVPLFRLLEDFDNYSRDVQSAQPSPAYRRQRTRQPRSRLTTFNPKFDVRETEDSYQLHGELPGLERDNVNIEFTEPQTIVIRGRVERTYAPESTNNTTEEIIATDEVAATESTTSETPEAEKSPRHSFQATVEDDPEDENTPASTPASSPKPETAKPASETQEVTKPAPAETQKQPQPQYYRWERSVGEFSRAFTFPARVEHEGVTASLSNGILNVTVPKSKRPVARRIEISFY
jgi:HSP20 family molecular chaperone IbpA